jgi:hypothetical protein
MSLMKVTAIRRVRILVALSVLGTTLLAAPALAATKQAPTVGHAAHPAAADPHHPFGEDLLRACAAEMGSLPVDLTLPSTSSANWVPSFQITPDASECLKFGWAEFNAPAAEFNVIPEFAGPNVVTSDWDCNHTSLMYGVFGQTSSGQWVYLRGGLEYGKRSGSGCGHDVGNFPTQLWGANSQKQWGGGRFRIGTMTWTHNDRRFGHPGNLCSDPENCYWNSLLRVVVG